MLTDPLIALPGAIPATQAEVDAGVITNKYVSPKTLTDWSGGGGGGTVIVTGELAVGSTAGHIIAASVVGDSPTRVAPGVGSVDLQQFISADYSGAAGTYSAIPGGKNVRVYGNTSFVFGEGSGVNGDHCAVLSGINHYIDGGVTYATILAGSGNMASRNYSTVINGIGAVAHSQGQTLFGLSGGSQTSACGLLSTTTDDTPTSMTIMGLGGAFLSIASGRVVSAIIVVVGSSNDGSKAASYTRNVRIKNIGGTTTLLGGVFTLGTDFEDDPLTDVTISADDTNDALDVKVTGLSGETWKWAASVQMIELSAV